MKIVNVTHGSFYALGAYAAASITGALLARGMPPSLSYAVLLGSAVLVSVIVAPLIERGILRFMYAKDEVVILLITYALFLILEDVIKMIGGAFTAPTVSVVPALGVEVIVLSFAVVVIGGLGSLPGAALGAVMVGLVRSAAIHYLPQAELFVIYLVMAMVLAFRPRGLFSI